MPSSMPSHTSPFSKQCRRRIANFEAAILHTRHILEYPSREIKFQIIEGRLDRYWEWEHNIDSVGNMHCTQKLF